jgi:hypothetical protein
MHAKAPAEAPASSSASLIALLAALMGGAWFGLRRRSRQLRPSFRKSRQAPTNSWRTTSNLSGRLRRSKVSRSEWPALVPLHLMDKDLSGTRDVDDFPARDDHGRHRIRAQPRL